jgi:hypothetical protein
VSIYEILVVVALLGAGAYAYRLYRLDTRARPPAQPAPESEPQTNRLMFGREPQDKARDGK